MMLDGTIGWYPVFAATGKLDDESNTRDNLQLKIVFTRALPRVGERVALIVIQGTEGPSDDVLVFTRVVDVEYSAGRFASMGIWIYLEPVDDTQRERLEQVRERLIALNP